MMRKQNLGNVTQNLKEKKGKYRKETRRKNTNTPTKMKDTKIERKTRRRQKFERQKEI